ncbi:hypothetical protein KY343_02305 [Candidatus Woesearchaeota archaeon]|nr:hypothetical protein [Candidatus Woesearchaeota archaeon]
MVLRVLPLNVKRIDNIYSELERDVSLIEGNHSSWDSLKKRFDDLKRPLFAKNGYRSAKIEELLTEYTLQSAREKRMEAKVED